MGGETGRDGPSLFDNPVVIPRSGDVWNVIKPSHAEPATGRGLQTGAGMLRLWPFARLMRGSKPADHRPIWLLLALRTT
jgi:hypothetical protein